MLSESDRQPWTSLDHNGILFPPPYRPHGVPLLHKGVPLSLPPPVEEAVTMYAECKLAAYQTPDQDLFDRNFLSDFFAIVEEAKTTGGDAHSLPEDFSEDSVQMADLDFSLIVDFLEKQKEQKRKEKPDREAKRSAELPFTACLKDGEPKGLASWKMEPPGLFRGRGMHPKMGRIKRRVNPSDVTINWKPADEDSEPPIPRYSLLDEWPPAMDTSSPSFTPESALAIIDGGEFNIEHNPSVPWVARWVSPVTELFQYVHLMPPSLRSSSKAEPNFIKLDRKGSASHEQSKSIASKPDVVDVVNEKVTAVVDHCCALLKPMVLSSTPEPSQPAELPFEIGFDVVPDGSPGFGDGLSGIQVVLESSVGVVAVTATLLKTALKSAVAEKLDKELVALSETQPRDVLSRTALLLLGAPMNYHFWNTRKRAIVNIASSASPESSSSLEADLLLSELVFSALVLSKHWKAPEAWAHRWWVLDRLSNCKGDTTSGVFERTLALEWDVIQRSASRHPKNYPAWQHAVQIGRKLLATSRNPIHDGEGERAMRALQDLLSRLSDYHEKHVSDASSSMAMISILKEVISSTYHEGLAPAISASEVAFAAEWLHRMIQSNTRMLRHHWEHGHEGLWAVRRGIITLVAAVQQPVPTSLPASVEHVISSTALLGSWDLEAELEWLQAHIASDDVDTPTAEVPQLRDGLATNGGTARWHAYYAASYGLWLIDNRNRFTTKLAS